MPSSFAGQVKLHSILIRTSQSASAPKTLKVFQNRDDVDFEAAEDALAEQEFELSQTSEVQDLPVKRAKFGKVQRLALFFPDNFGDGDEDVTRISYLGFKGEWMQLGRAPANILVSRFPSRSSPRMCRCLSVTIRWVHYFHGDIYSETLALRCPDSAVERFFFVLSVHGMKMTNSKYSIVRGCSKSERPQGQGYGYQSDGQWDWRSWSRPVGMMWSTLEEFMRVIHLHAADLRRKAVAHYLFPADIVGFD